MALFVTARHDDTYQDNDNPPAGIIYVYDCLLIGSAGEINPPEQHQVSVSVLGDDAPNALRSKIASQLRAYFASIGHTIPTGSITFNDFVKG